MQMNITHLKYAVEIARTGSITQAAENLYMSQPNLSKAIKEFESTLGFVVFKRTSKGIEPTQKGRELIERARELLAQIDEMDAAFLAAAQSTQALSVSVPRASYIAHAFTRFVNHLDMAGGMDIDFCETNSVAAITNVAEGESALGVIRCPKETEKYFFSLLSEKGLAHELLLEYKYRLLFSEKSPLADRTSIRRADLEDYIEIVHGDLTVPFLPMTKQKSRLSASAGRKKIRVYERGSQFDLLRKCRSTYMWVSPMPRELLDCYGLIQADCADNEELYCDHLIYPAGAGHKKIQRLFVENLRSVREELF